ncbi:MAG: LysE family translocator [Hyphomicrobiales bacterium]|nr:LysE family translocator [Hyphomicrobiales bacterium]
MDDAFASSLGAFALMALAIEITPGPNMGYLAVLSLSRGWQVGAAAVIGVGLGHAIYGVAAALGVAALIDASPLLYGLLRWGGVAYMVWLAYEAWSSQGGTPSDIVGDVDPRLLQRAFRQGLVTNLLNPKAAIFFIAVVPTFIRPGASVVTQTLILSGVFVAVATIVHLTIVLLAGRLKGFVNDPARRRPIRRALAIVLLCIAAWLAWSTAR